MYQIVIALSLGLACTLRAADTSDHFSDNGYGKTVSNMQHPAAEYFNGVTYVAYQGPHEDPYVAAYTHATGTWAGPVRAGVNLMGLSPDQVDPGALDNHGRPALVVDGQGYIHLIFGGHGGSFLFGENKFGTPGSGRQTHVVTEKPGDISSWKVLDNVPPFGTYGQWVKLANNDLYLFYRHGAHRSDWVYQKSTDHARSFAPPFPSSNTRSARPVRPFTTHGMLGSTMDAAIPLPPPTCTIPVSTPLTMPTGKIPISCSWIPATPRGPMCRAKR